MSGVLEKHRICCKWIASGQTTAYKGYNALATPYVSRGQLQISHANSKQLIAERSVCHSCCARNVVLSPQQLTECPSTGSHANHYWLLCSMLADAKYVSCSPSSPLSRRAATWHAWIASASTARTAPCPPAPRPTSCSQSATQSAGRSTRTPSGKAQADVTATMFLLYGTQRHVEWSNRPDDHDEYCS